jgi:hypothetical protein
MIEKPSLDEAQLAEYQQWKRDFRAPDLSLWDFIRFHGKIEHALVLGQLFVPDFIEVRDFVFIRDKFEPQSLESWIAELDGNRQSIERVINHTHIYDLFHDPVDTPSRLYIAEQLALMLRFTWSLVLAHGFPQRRFAFEYGTEPDEYGPTITFYQLD